MKKTLSILLALSLIFCFISCAYIEEDDALSDMVGEIVGKLKGGEYTVHALYDYGFHMTDKAVLLYDHSTLFFEIPESHGAVLGGDCFTVEYTGELLIQESYPSSVIIVDGEIVSVKGEHADIIELIYTPSALQNAFALASGEPEGFAVASAPQYYIADPAQGSFESLPTEGEPINLFATYCAEHGIGDDGGYTLLGLYLENPR